MKKRILAMILTFVIALGALPAFTLPAFGDSFGLYASGYEGVTYNPATLEMTDIVLLFTYGCDDQTAMSQSPGNYTWVLSIDGVDYTVQPSSFYDNWLVRFKPLSWSTPYTPAWGSTAVFALRVYSGNTEALNAGNTQSITFPARPTRPESVAATPVASGSSVTWSYDSATAKLTFDGTGVIPSYSDTSDRPWNDIKDAIVSVEVKGGITAIGDRACNSLNNLDEIILAQGVTSTGFDCFAHCGTITSVYLPTTLTSMAQGGFYGSSIIDVYYDDTSRDFGERCKMGSYNTAITNANWVNDPDWGSFGDLSDDVQWSFDSATGTLTITGTGAIPSPATKPWQQYVSQITKIVIGDGLTEIPGGGLFSHVDNLDRVEMPETIVKIGGDAFAYNGTISYLRLSSNVTSIGQGVLYYSSVTTISCKKDWTAIRNQASVGNYNDSFGNATWVDVEVVGEVHHLSFGKYGSGMENWQGNGDPTLTQILIATPKWDGEYCAALNSVEWTLKIEAADGSISPCLMTMYPRSVYDGGDWSILRFVPALCMDPANRFKPVNGKEYVITATVTYGNVTDTVTSSDKYVLNDDPIEFDTYYDITWQIEGVTEYVENIPAGFKPVYHGTAASYVSGNYVYAVNIPETVAADANVTYNITYTQTDMTVGTLGLWGSGYENWGDGNQTQFLLRTWDREGNEHTAIDGHTGEYTWILTVNGVEYDVKPSSNYGSMIWRFEPALWSTPLIPRAGETYSVALAIYDAENALIFRSAENVTISIAADFVPTHDHTFTQTWTWSADFSAASLTLSCPVCSAAVTVEAEVTVNDDNSFTATAIYAEQTYTDVAFGYQAGDINGDRTVSIDDVSALLDYLKNGSAEGLMTHLLDVDCNEIVDISDVSTILDILAGGVVLLKNGLYEEDGGLRYYVQNVMSTGFVTLRGYKLYFDPETGLMRSDAITVGDDAYAAPTAVAYDARTVYVYGDPVFTVPEDGVLALAPNGSLPAVCDGFNPCVDDHMVTAIFDFYNTGYGLDLAPGTQISYTITRGDGTTVTGTAELDGAFAPIVTDNGYIGLRFAIGFVPDLYETINLTLSFFDRNGKQFIVTQASFTRSLAFMGLSESSFSDLAAKGITATVNESRKEIVLTGRVGSVDYTHTIDLANWGGLITAAQVVECANLFFDVYPKMYERFHDAGGCPETLTVTIDPNVYSPAATGGNHCWVNERYLCDNPNDFDCLTHEYAHTIQNGWDGNYCEVSGYIEQFADAARYLYATESGKKNDLGWNIAPEDSSNTRTASTRFLLWMDYTYSTPGNDLLVKFFTACKSKQYKANRWSNAWTYIFQGSGLQGKTADQAWQEYLASDFATLSTKVVYGVSPLEAKYNVRGKAGIEPCAYALYFPLCNSQNVNDYTTTWSATLAGQEWTLVNMNNRNSAYEYAASGTTAYVRTTIAAIVASFVIDLKVMYSSSVDHVALKVYNGSTLLTSLPLQNITGRQVVRIPEEYRAAGLTYEFELVSKNNTNGVYRLEHIIVHKSEATSASAEDEPEINTAAWAEYVLKNGGSAAYADFEVLDRGLYNVTHSGANNGSPFENNGDGKLQFLPILGNAPFDLRNTSKYTWTIWYKDIDDGSDAFRSIETKPWSTYEGDTSTIYRVPTYRDGMTDIHSDDGEINYYKFIIVITETSTGRTVCWCRLNVAVTDSYDMYASEQT